MRRGIASAGRVDVAALATMLAALFLGGCVTGFTTSGGVTMTIGCEAVAPEAGPAIDCNDAITVANAAIPPGRAAVTSMEVRTGDWCPPNARCRAPDPSRGHVIVQFAQGNPVLISLEARANALPVVVEVRDLQPDDLSP